MWIRLFKDKYSEWGRREGKAGGGGVSVRLRAPWLNQERTEVYWVA